VPLLATLSPSPPAVGTAVRPAIFDIEKSSFRVVSPVVGSSVIADPKTCPRPEDSAGGS
jgi:hypothetical protein